MAEPIRPMKTSHSHRRTDDVLGGPYALDVLLIADDPQSRGTERPRKRAMAAGRIESIEPLDMESVVRRLIAALSESKNP